MASVGHGNYIIPSQCAVVAQAYTAYELFPAGTFVDADGDTITYTASPPWQDTGTTSYKYQLLKVGGGVKFNPNLIYGTPLATLVSGFDGMGGVNYSVTIYATSADSSVDSLSFNFRVGNSTQAMPRYAVSNSQKKITLSVQSDLVSVGSAAHTLGTTADQYSIVWSDDNQVGDAEGVNRSPFSISNTGVITVTGTLSAKTYKLWVRATYSTYGLFDTCWVEITSAYSTAIDSGYKMIDGGFGGLCK